MPPAPEASDQPWRAPEAAPPQDAVLPDDAVLSEDAGSSEDAGLSEDAAESPVTGTQDPIDGEQAAGAWTADAPTAEGGAAEVPDELDEAALLDQLESDLAAVETAIASIEQIATDSVGGERAAAEIRAAVSAERFGS